MKLGALVRADTTGLGVQTWEFWRHLKPDLTVIVDVQDVNATKPPMNAARFEGAPIVRLAAQHGEFVTDDIDFTTVDTVISFETYYNWDLLRSAQRAGATTFLQYNWEMLDHVHQRRLPRPHVWLAPSRWCLDEMYALHLGRVEHLPVPVARDVLPHVRRTEARRFLHIVGRAAAWDRNGTNLVLEAWQHVRADVELIVRSQQPMRVPDDPRIRLEVGDLPDYQQITAGADVLLLPRRFGGLCLPMQEAFARGMPAIMLDCPPQEFLPQQMRVPTDGVRWERGKVRMLVYDADPWDVAARVDLFATHPDLVTELSFWADGWATEHSWETLLPKYRETLTGVYSDGHG